MIRLVALVSALYDLTVGVMLFFYRESLQAWFGVGAPAPPIHADLNAIFVTVVGLGFVLPLRDPDRYRAYLWLFGPLLKGLGAAAFLIDYFVRRSPASYLLFAASDGLLALVTLVVLMRVGRSRPTPSTSPLDVAPPTDAPSYRRET